MRRFITIDGGTTSTRISLVADGKILKTVKSEVGVRTNMSAKGSLAMAVSYGITSLLREFDLSENDIEKIIASGMITSEHGLYELDHILAPAGVRELRAGVRRVSLPEITSIPFYFVPGVKMGAKDLESADMMRGEETELVGLMLLPEIAGSDALFVLPGSHSKLIRTNRDGRIYAFSTMLSGEMIASLASGTILRDAVDLKCGTARQKELLDGYNFCHKHGINKTLFKVRTYKNLLGASPVEVYSFYLGAVLCGEIDAILAEKTSKIVISGNKHLKDAMTVLLRALTNTEIICVPDEVTEKATMLGLLSVASDL